MQKIIFEWDEEKNRANVRKHGIDFALALKVFDDPYYLEFYDTLHSTRREERFIVYGVVERVLVVVYTVRSPALRIISA